VGIGPSEVIWGAKSKNSEPCALPIVGEMLYREKIGSSFGEVPSHFNTREHLRYCCWILKLDIKLGEE